MREYRLRVWVGPVVAAVAVVIVSSVGMASWLSSGGGRSGLGGTGAGGTDGPALPAPSDWRVESYRGVQLRVPPSWGWGGVPMAGSGGLTFCGDGAFASPRGSSEEGSGSLPYVGRAGYAMTDLCVVGSQQAPVAPFVWLGSPLEPGSTDLSGVPVETVESGGVRVSVGDRDAHERAQILAGVEAVRVDAAGCDAMADLAGPWGGVSGIGAVDAVSVCAYRFAEGGRPFLGYSTRLVGPDARHALEQLQDAPETPGDCADAAAGLSVTDAVVLRLHGHGRTSDALVRLGGCAGYDTSEGGLRQLTRSNVSSWVVDGVGLYVDGGMVGNALSGLLHTPPG